MNSPAHVFKTYDTGTAIEVNPHGARIQHLSIHGHTLLSTFTRGDSKEGSSHPCSPLFGPEITTSYGLPQHGPMRNTPCTVEESESSITLRGDISIGTYPNDITMTQRIELTPDACTITTTHSNAGHQEAPVNFGEHFYWNCPKGWNGITLNGVDVTAQVRANALMNLPQRSQIQIPGMPPISLVQEGLSYIMLWSYPHPDQYDIEYVCLEPVEGNPIEFFGSRESMIQPQSSRSCMMTISL